MHVFDDARLFAAVCSAVNGIRTPGKFRRYSTLPVVFAAVLVLIAALGIRAQTPRTRSIEIVTEPGASVWLNDVYFGKAGQDGKLSVITALTGRGGLRVRADGFAEAVKPLLPAQSGEIRIPLTKTADPAELAYQEAIRLTQVDRDKAAAAFNKAIKLRPTHIQARIGLARVLAEARKYDESLKAIAALRRVNAAVPEASAIEGRVQKESGRSDKAIVAFKRAIREGRGFQPEAYTGLGLLYSDRAEMAASEGDFDAENANYDEAAANYRIAARQLIGSPDAMVVYQLLGLVYENQKKYPEAIEVYNEFLELFPNSDEAPAVRSFITQLKKQMQQ